MNILTVTSSRVLRLLTIRCMQILTITGSGFDASNVGAHRVWVGAKECYVRTATATTITCRARGGGTFGTLPILVRVGSQFASGELAVTGVLEVHSISPGLGSLQGGSIVTVAGAGFAVAGSVFSTNFVSIGVMPAAPCRVLHASWDTIVCQTEPAGHMHAGALAGATNPLEVSVNGVYAQCQLASPPHAEQPLLLPHCAADCSDAAGAAIL
jgi:IPT/TIG domain